MADIGLVEMIERIRDELSRAIVERPDGALEFPVQSVTVTLQVGVTREGGGNGGINLHVLQLGASGKYANESVQTITLELGAPLDAHGRPVQVAAHADRKPG